MLEPSIEKTRRIPKITAIVGVLVAVGGFGLGLFSCRVPQLGVEAGQLTPCPDSPNCVCSQDPKPSHHIEPIPFAGDPAEALRQAKKEILGWPRSTLIDEAPGYLRVQFSSFVFRFKDDLELLVDAETQVIHVRAAARIGYSDMGVNRARVQKLREALRAGG